MRMDSAEGSDATPLTFGSLFAGIGGFDLGFERAGLQCKWQVEIDDYAKKVLAKHWPDVRRHGDIRTFPPSPNWRVDCVVGGFPCQDISYAGHGAGLAGERSGLFFEAMRVVRELEPRFVVLENVAALLTRGIHDVLGTLASLGFDAEWHCIPAAAIGAPHIRDRVFVIASSNATKQHGTYHDATAHECRRMGSDVPDALRPEWQSGSGRRGVRKGNAELANANSNGRDSRRNDNAIDDRDELAAESWWSIEPDVGRVAHGIPARVDRLRGIGNAVVPQVAEWIGRRIAEANQKSLEV